MASTSCDATEHDPASETPTSPEEANGLHYALPPADRGKDAWLILAAVFILEGLVWGKALHFPIILVLLSVTDFQIACKHEDKAIFC